MTLDDYQRSPTMYKISKSGGIQVWKCSAVGPEVISNFGKQGGKLRDSKYTCEAKNIGRSNETTPEEQAILELKSSYEDQYNNKHYRFSIEDAQGVVDACIVPMKISNYKDHPEKVKFPCYVSIKANGSRAMFKDKKVISKAGRVEDFKVPHIEKAVEQLSIDVDGEVYKHGYSLQRIQSARNKVNEDTENLGLVIFDTPLRGVVIEERIQKLKALRREIRHLGLQDILTVHVPKLCTSEEQLKNIFDDVTPEWEGVVIWNKETYYEFGVRSNNILKWKPRYDAEARVLDVSKDKNGNGKLHVRACDKLGNVKFKVMMKVKRRDGNEYPRDYETMCKLKGSWITFSYEELSDKGIPTKPVGECPRRCNLSGEPLE